MCTFIRDKNALYLGKKYFMCLLNHMPFTEYICFMYEWWRSIFLSSMKRKFLLLLLAFLIAFSASIFSSYFLPFLYSRIAILSLSVSNWLPPFRYVAFHT